MSGFEALQTPTSGLSELPSVALATGVFGDEHLVRNRTSARTQRTVRMKERTSIVLSQAVTSLTNALLGFEIARRSSSKELGALGIAIALSLVVIGASRACCTELLLQRPVDGDEPMARRVAWQISVIGLVTLGAAALVLGPSVRVGVGLIAVAMPFMVMEDFERFVAFRDGAWRAVVGDTTWLVSMVVVFGLLYRSGSRSTSAVVFAYVVGGLAGWLAMSTRNRRTVMHSGSRGWWAAHPVRARTYGEEFVTSTVLSGLSLPLIGVTAGLAAAGDVRAYMTLLGPVTFTVQVCLLLSSRRIGHLELRSCVTDGRLWALSAVCALPVAAVGLVARLLPVDQGLAFLGPSWVHLADNSLSIMALALLAPFAIAPTQISRLQFPRQAMKVRCCASLAALAVIAFPPIGASLANYLLASLIGQGMIALFTSWACLSVYRNRAQSKPVRVGILQSPDQQECGAGKDRASGESK
jgi:hypothetical protein